MFWSNFSKKTIGWSLVRYIIQLTEEHEREQYHGGQDVIFSPYTIDLYLEKLGVLKDQIALVQFKVMRQEFDQVLTPEVIGLTILNQSIVTLLSMTEFYHNFF